MENSADIFPIGRRVMTPVGPGVVAGTIYRGNGDLNIIVSTDARPLSIYDNPEMMVIHAHAFPAEVLRLIPLIGLVES